MSRWWRSFIAGFSDSGGRISEDGSPSGESWSRQAVQSMTKSDLICKVSELQDGWPAW